MQNIYDNKKKIEFCFQFRLCKDMKTCTPSLFFIIVVYYTKRTHFIFTYTGCHIILENTPMRSNL
jgi:hypothetical protein